MTRNDSFQPAYLKLGAKKLMERSLKARGFLSPCVLCPRQCGADRIGGEFGHCKTGLVARVSSRNLHHGEEPPISGHRGSGTVFFTYCNLKCVFCQNYPISQMGVGEPADAAQLAEMMLQLQEKGAHNINFVTPSHVVASILEALAIAVKQGLKIPLVYNSSGYDSMDELELLDGVVDIYMPDAKYADNDTAERLSKVDNYVEVNREALKEMNRQVGILQMDNDGVAQRGLLIRHLVLPEGLAGTDGTMKFISEELSKETYISLMSQYFPANKASIYPEISRGVTSKEYKTALSEMHKYGIHNGFIQNTPP